MRCPLILATIAIFATTAQAEPSVNATGQLLVASGRSFGDYTFYAQTGVLLSTRSDSTPVMLNYFGGQIKYGKVSVKLLTGLLMAGNNTSAIGSIWYDQDLPNNQLHLFVEGDAYLPVDGHSSRAYYTYANLSWNGTAGLGQENFFSGKNMLEGAVGPTLSLSKATTLWFAYDFAAEDHPVMARLVLFP